ncbi:MAG: N-6 DNA methylase [Candidatus Nanoarchaeia archaeon]|nr:N-6 DNA methylase [Candidatus Nanoarchaeia archaeon]
MNERKTENIVRKHFEKFSNIIIEEKKSDNLKIDKLLKNASKKGSGTGYPEFIISFKDNQDFIIVIECKADIIKHESKTRDKYDSFAVDGALLYSSFLSKEFDVLAIAISGEDIKNLKINHFLQLCGEKYNEVLSNKLLTSQNYLDWYLKSPEKTRQDYNSLLKYAKDLNTKLHLYKIPEGQRALLISCILVALEDKAFKTSYQMKNNPQSLSEFLVTTVLEKLEEAGIKGKNLQNLNIQFGFIKTDTSLSTIKDILKFLIKDIDDNINQFIKTHEYYDVLGKLYIEFLRYANSDKGLGIVLTPPHITVLFSDLAQVTKESIVYDNCAGTGGFLISAMKKMIIDAKGDSSKINEIKNSQLHGVEYQAHIFALIVSNMYIHQDGKTNIINASCFDNNIIQYISTKKPTIGFLNPPYKSDKKNDIEELEFVNNNLTCLIESGICIAIVPMSCALATSGRIYEIKKKIFNQHTLEAVLSMPDELFVDSIVGMVTCVMIFKAHKPHPKNKKTFFGYFKNDGYEKRRNGRIDFYGKWDNIKKEWLKAFINRENIPYLSINREVTVDDEWCAEAYLKTDFTKMKDENFIFNLKEHSIYLFTNNLSSEVSINSVNKTGVKLNFSKFDFCRVDKIFDVYSGGDKPNPNDTYHWGGEIVNSIENQTTNNGIKEKIEFKDTNKIFQDFISIVSIGEGGKAFYQSERGVCFTRVKSLIPKAEHKINFNKYIFLFFCSLLDMERFRYGYGRVLSKDRLAETELFVPINKFNNLDWQFMEDYIKSLPYSSNL